MREEEGKKMVFTERREVLILICKDSDYFTKS
jgi:hypothetical protein